MADRLEAEGFPVYPVPLGSQLGCIDRKAGEISKYLDAHGLEDGAFFFFFGGGGGGCFGVGWWRGLDWMGAFGGVCVMRSVAQWIVHELGWMDGLTLPPPHYHHHRTTRQTLPTTTT